jgi:hypothetical protein
MPAYVIAEHIITNAAKFEEYRTKVGPMIAKYGGRYLTKGGSELTADTRRPVVAGMRHRTAGQGPGTSLGQRFEGVDISRRSQSVAGRINLLEPPLQVTPIDGRKAMFGPKFVDLRGYCRQLRVSLALLLGDTLGYPFRRMRRSWQTPHLFDSYIKGTPHELAKPSWSASSALDVC